MTEQERAILAAMDSLPAGSPVRRIGLAVGSEITVSMMMPLVGAGLVAEVQRTEPPMLGYSLTKAGRSEAAHVRQAHHPTVRTPEMSEAWPLAALRERVSKSDLLEAIADGRSSGWIMLRYSATHRGLDDLLAEYGLTGISSEDARRELKRLGGMEVNAVIDYATKRRLYAQFTAGRGQTAEDRQALASEFGVSAKTIGKKYRLWHERGEELAAETPAASEPSSPAQSPTPEQPAPALSANMVVDETAASVVSEDDGEESRAVELMSLPPPVAELAAEPDQLPPASILAAQRSLCDTCLKADVCAVRLAGHFREEVQLTTTQLPEDLTDMTVIFGGREVKDCSHYRRE